MGATTEGEPTPAPNTGSQEASAMEPPVSSASSATESPIALLRRPDIRLALAPRSALWITLGILGALFSFSLARNIPDTLTRTALGLILALALDPVVVRIRHRLHCTRGVAVGIVGLVAVALFVVVVAAVGPQAVHQAQSFSSDLPNTVDKLTTLPVIGEVLKKADAPTRIRGWVDNLPSRLSDDAIARIVSTFVGGVVAGMTVLVVGIALLADGEILILRLRSLVPERHRDRAVLVGQVFYRTVGAYFAGSLLLSALAATFVLTVGMALGVPLAPVAALWVLVVNLIPQIGGFLSALMFSILGFAESPTTGLACLILYWLYMITENHILQPLIIGTAVDLPAAATMLAALIGGAAGGVPGAIIATPLVGTGKALYLELRYPGSIPQKRSRLLTRIVKRFRST